MSNFGDLVNIEEFGDKREDFSKERGDITFYCKDCLEIVETDRPNPKGFTFVCNKCKGENIAVGTLEGIKTKFRIK